MNRQRLFCTNFIVSIFLLLSLFLVADLFAADTSSTGLQNKASSADSVHAILSGLSDEQVRQMLLEELKKEAGSEDQFSLEPELKGPGTPFFRILRALNRQSVESEQEFRTLWAGIPNLFPDLYKVFISL